MPREVAVCPSRLPLPAPPHITLRVLRDHATDARPFVEVKRYELVAGYPDASESETFTYDVVTRRALDAVVVVAHYVEAGTPRIYLRSAIRPPLSLRDDASPHEGELWELAAGLIEPGESARDAAARELEEELGVHVDADALKPLGGPTWPAPGMVGERHHFFHVACDPKARRVPSEDGSPLERAAAIIALPLADALEHCRSGAIADAKTELALRRFAEIA